MVKLLKKLKPFWLPVTVITLLVFFQSIAELYLPNIMSDIVDTGIVNGDTDYIIQRGLIMLAIAAGAGVFAIVASYLTSKVAVGYGKNLRKLSCSCVRYLEPLLAYISLSTLHQLDISWSLGYGELACKVLHFVLRWLK